MTIPRPPVRPIRLMDIEVFKNYFLIGFTDATTLDCWEFELYPGGPALDRAGIDWLLQTSTLITFNGNHYDVPMMSLALTGANNATLKQASDGIILGNLRSWQFERQWNVSAPSYLDHIDLFDVAPGMASLKIYGGRLHSKRMQDLPIEPDALISPEQRAILRQYRRNDDLTTLDLYTKLKPQIELRANMSKVYGMDLRSKSDAQIAEAVIKSQIGGYIERPTIPHGTTFQFKAPSFVSFQTPQLQAVLDMVQRAVFTVSDKETAIDDTDVKTGIQMPKELTDAKVRIGNGVYRMGIGGLHSSESCAVHVSDGAHVLSDHDVTSYYPSIILNCGLYPYHLGPRFLEVFRNIFDSRVAAKRSKDKVTDLALKIVLNGSFGKFGSKWSILFSPNLLIQVTLTGQLSLLMLIEMLELCGIPVVSANTDGIVVKCPLALEPMRDQIMQWWESVTGFGLDMTSYGLLASRDVNNYIAIKPNGEHKGKGAYADPGLQKNPANMICVDAAVAYLAKGIPLADTVTSCRDITKFVTIRSVKGGGEKYHGTEIADPETQKGRKEQMLSAGWHEPTKGLWAKGQACGPLEQMYPLALQQLRLAAPVRKEYLGKAVRWYYAKDEPGAIHYASNGNKVARSEGAKPLMELPDNFPADVDFDWYVKEAKSLLSDMGVVV